MMSVFSHKLLNVLFSICFSGVIFLELSKLFNDFTINLLFVIMFLYVARYVYKTVEADDELDV